MRAHFVEVTFNHTRRSNAAIHFDRQTLLRPLVRYRQALQLLAIGAPAEHEVVGPHLVRPSRRIRPPQRTGNVGTVEGLLRAMDPRRDEACHSDGTQLAQHLEKLEVGMIVSDIDLRLLRVFRAVVEAGGFSNAQAILDVGTSTISTQMATLEARLGYVLCNRGRGGFRLTEKGETLYRLVVQLFSSVQTFETQAAELKEGLKGQVRVGFLDNIVSDPYSPLRRAVEMFRKNPNNHARLLLEVMTPQELERALLDQRIDAALSIFYSKRPGLAYEELYRQREVLLCREDHPLAAIKGEDELLQALPGTDKILRSFLGTSEFSHVNGDGETSIHNVSHIEASALLILTGGCIGFLPEHYATPWIASGELVELLPHRLFRDSLFSIATLADTSYAPPALSFLLDCLRRVAASLEASRLRPAQGDWQPAACPR